MDVLTLTAICTLYTSNPQENINNNMYQFNDGHYANKSIVSDKGIDNNEESYLRADDFKLDSKKESIVANPNWKIGGYKKILPTKINNSINFSKRRHLPRNNTGLITYLSNS